MPASIGVNLRVTGHCRQGGRKYMEDFFSVAYQQTQDEKDLEYAFFGIFDGHGGMEAATFAKEHLMESIVRQKNFWSDRDDDVLKAIKDGYINTHYAMWREQEKWPKTASGLPSTAGTTASVAFIRRGKIYIGHVGDSGIILGFQEPGNPIWQARPLTEDHKPENQSEMSRIEQSGGKVVTKSGVPRVVWNRPRIGHKGPVRRSTPIDEIPFLAVARSLGDLWSYNSALDEFVVSPDPDTICIPINADTFRCLIFGTDGLWNMISPASAVSIVQVAEQHNERTVLAAADSQDVAAGPGGGRATKVWINPSKCLVERALERWSNTRMRADNTSVITLMLDPPGPPRAEVIKNQRLLENRRLLQQQQQQEQQQEAVTNIPEEIPEYPKNGLEILTMYEDPPIAYPFPENDATPETENLKPPGSAPAPQEPPPAPTEPPEPPERKPEKIVERRLTEENLNKIHRQILNDINNAQNHTEFDQQYGDGTPEDGTICETTSDDDENPKNPKSPKNPQISTSETINTRLKSQNNVYKCVEHLQEFCKTCLKLEAAKTDVKLVRSDVKLVKPSDVKLIKSDVKLIKSDVKLIKSDVKLIKSDVKLIKSDVKLIKSDVKLIKSDVKLIKSDVKLIKSDVKLIKSDVKLIKPDVKLIKSDVKLVKPSDVKTAKSHETIQINEVSSSSPDKPPLLEEDDEPCSRCTRSQGSQAPQVSQGPPDSQKTRKSLRTTVAIKQKLANSTSPMPRRKTRSTHKTTPILRKTFGGASKREHSDPELKTPVVDSTRQAVEPPPKLRRSQSLGPRDFTLRSQKTERSLRDRTGTSLTSLTNRNGAIQGRSSLVTLSAGSANSYRKFSSNGKHFTPVKQAIQTRNRVKRLNK